jgi:hypothetical protein
LATPQLVEVHQQTQVVLVVETLDIQELEVTLTAEVQETLPQPHRLKEIMVALVDKVSISSSVVEVEVEALAVLEEMAVPTQRLTQEVAMAAKELLVL